MACRLIGIHRAVISICLLCCAQAPTLSIAQTPGLYLIYDSSNSMWGTLPDGSRKVEAARTALQSILETPSPGHDMALRVYGHRHKNDCNDSELVVPFGPPADTAELMLNAIDGIRPRGRTPIDLSLRRALDDFGSRSGSIVLVSDGIESCNADPCALVRAWQKQSVDISVHVVGLGLHGVERKALHCIAEAAGTRYHDAHSATEVLDSLGAVMEQANATEHAKSNDPNPTPEPTKPDFKLVVQTADGMQQKGAGELRPAHGDPIPVESFKRFTPPPGDYTLVAGVQMLGGAIYQPVETRVTVAPTGRTTATLTAPRPPEVSARFSMAGEDLRATTVQVRLAGKVLGSFKGDASAFVPEGELTFRTTPHRTKKRLEVTEQLSAGDSRVIVFEAPTSVHLTVIATASANGERLLSKPATELWRDGKRAHKINSRSGGIVTPGRYALRIDDRLNRIELPVTVSGEPEQLLEITVATGALTVAYENSSGTREPAKRVFITPAGSKRRTVHQSDRSVALIPGDYDISGWPANRDYPSQRITITENEWLDVVLRARAE